MRASLLRATSSSPPTASVPAPPGGDVVVVSHVTPIKAAVAWALGMTAELSWRLHLQTASVTRIGWGNGHPVLHGFNEVVPNRDAATPHEIPS